METDTVCCVETAGVRYLEIDTAAWLEFVGSPVAAHGASSLRGE